MSKPKDQLKEGVAVLEPLLRAHGFKFKFDGSGHSSGGEFASGAFVSGDRRLETHVRYSLGLVTYSIGAEKLNHETHMRLLGVFPKNRYPNFSDDVQSQFAALASDISEYCQDFVSGDGARFRELDRQFEQNPSVFRGLPA